MKVRVFVFALLVFALSMPSIAQTCSNAAATNDLICAVPQLFGPGGLVLPNTKHEAHFASASLNTFRPLNTAIGEELATLPLGSAGSGVSFTFDQTLHIPVSTEESLGPVLTDRAGTIGAKKIDVGVAYQRFNFGEIDGLHLDRLQAVFAHEVPPNTQPKLYQNDYITTSNHVELTLHQVVLYGVVGITKDLDVSVAVPIEKVHLGVSSDAFIVRTQPCEFTGTCTDPGEECGEFHYFVRGANCEFALTSTSKTFTNSKEQTGIGDVVLRGKYQVKVGEKYAVAGGIDVRLPTGDEKNFLGAGTVGVTPFLVAGYRGRLSPHIKLGYQWNGDSILAGDPTSTTGSKAGLPHEFIYAGGADYRLTHRITIAADLVGQHVFDASRLKITTYRDFFGNSIPNIESYTGSYNSDAVALGAKARIVGRLIVTGNVTKRVDSGGLHANITPLVGVSYAFR